MTLTGSARGACFRIEHETIPTVMLLSPARLGGRRGRILMDPEASFELARALQSPEGAVLSDVFTFVSGLYFRGKASYARTFARARGDLPAAYVLTAGGGICRLDERVTLVRLRRWETVNVSEKNPHFTAPLVRHASELRDAHGNDARFILLGSVASNKYVEPLLDVLGGQLFYPKDFAGLGDMSRGSLLLRAVRDGRELPYVPLFSSRP